MSDNFETPLAEVGKVLERSLLRAAGRTGTPPDDWAVMFVLYDRATFDDEGGDAASMVVFGTGEGASEPDYASGVLAAAIKRLMFDEPTTITSFTEMMEGDE